LKNGQAAHRALSEYRIRILVIAGQPPSAIMRLLQPDDRPQNTPLQSKIWTAIPGAVD
jgi:hypothetical protein